MYLPGITVLDNQATNLTGDLQLALLPYAMTPPSRDEAFHPSERVTVIGKQKERGSHPSVDLADFDVTHQQRGNHPSIDLVDSDFEISLVPAYIRPGCLKC